MSNAHTKESHTQKSRTFKIAGQSYGVSTAGFGSDIGLRANSTEELISLIQEGFSFRVWGSLSSSIRVEQSTLADWIGIHERTLHRRRESGRFAPDESERILRFSTIFGKTVDLFEGDVEAATHWFTTPKKALSNHAPVEYARTEIGAREVENLIGRLEHGVFS